MGPKYIQNPSKFDLNIDFEVVGPRRHRAVHGSMATLLKNFGLGKDSGGAWVVDREGSSGDGGTSKGSSDASK